MLTRLEQFLDRQQIRSGRLLVGVSGGADSIALLLGLLELARQRSLEIVVGHFDHGLRADSADDARWVAALCHEQQILCETGQPSTPHPGRTEAHSRRRRYAFLTKTARTHNCSWLAVAHTADDQAETILHHLFRGSGLKGLTGIPELRPLTELRPSDSTSPSPSLLWLIRPLLQVSRNDILTYLESRQQAFRCDISNDDRRYTRNRIRHDILPLLRRELNPQVDAALLRLARQAQETQALVESLAAQALAAAVLEITPGEVRLQRGQLSTLPSPLARELFRLLWEQQHWPRQQLTFTHLDQLVTLACTGNPTRLSLPGPVTASCRQHVLHLRYAASPPNP